MFRRKNTTSIGFKFQYIKKHANMIQNSIKKIHVASEVVKL